MGNVSTNTVLLVDDDPPVRKMLALRLASAGLEVWQAENGIDAVAKLRQSLPNVIISDMAMPRMSGCEFISVVRWRFPSIPVIVFSGLSSCDFTLDTKPDHWFDKNPQHITKIVTAAHDLAGKTSDPAHCQQTICTPVRTRPSGSGYLILTCTDCLRSFEVPSRPNGRAVNQIANCTYCEAGVPYLIENPESE